MCYENLFKRSIRSLPLVGEEDEIELSEQPDENFCSDNIGGNNEVDCEHSPQMTQYNFVNVIF